MTEKAVIGFDTGGTNTRVAIASLGGEILEHKVERTNGIPGDELPKTIGTIIDEILNNSSKYLELVSMVGAIAGWVDYDNGILKESPNIPGVHDLNFRTYFEQSFDVPFSLLNDGNAAALGIRNYDPQFRDIPNESLRHLVYVIMGTGIGGGLILNGKIYRGAGQAGEIGHMILEEDGPKCGCNQYGCWEAICSGKNITLAARRAYGHYPESVIWEFACPDEESDVGKIQAKHVFQAARREDPIAKHIIKRVQKYNGNAIHNLIMLYNPEAIVLGEAVAQNNQDLIFDPLQEMLQADRDIYESTGLYMAQIDSPGLYGAIQEAINQI